MSIRCSSDILEDSLLDSKPKLIPVSRYGDPFCVHYDLIERKTHIDADIDTNDNGCKQKNSNVNVPELVTKYYFGQLGCKRNPSSLYQM